jgi:hypothetical protein
MDQVMKEKAYIEALLDIYAYADEAEAALQRFWPELEAIANDTIRDALAELATEIQNIQRASAHVLGGPDRRARLAHEREKAEQNETE